MRLPQFILGIGIIVLLVLIATPQRHPARYDVATESTLNGTVIEVRDFYCPISGHEGTHLTLATANGTVEVHVAPTRFLAGWKWAFYRGDHVEVSGSKVVFHGHSAMIARKIVRENQTIALRDASGAPLWAE